MTSFARQVLFFLVILAMPVASFFLVFKPQNNEIEKAKKEIEQKQAMLEKLREATRQTADLQRANEEVQKNIQAIRANLPSTKEMDNVLRQVSGLAGRADLRIPTFKKQSQQMQAGLAMEQPIDVEFVGDFDGFYQFLLDLEQLQRITRITDLKLVRSQKVDGEMKATMTLSIYYEKEDAGAAQ
jgi:type IV pilus assembly protein PilO